MWCKTGEEAEERMERIRGKWSEKSWMTECQTAELIRKKGKKEKNVWTNLTKTRDECRWA